MGHAHVPSAIFAIFSVSLISPIPPGRVAQLAEAVDLKSIQCGFESRRGYCRVATEWRIDTIGHTAPQRGPALHRNAAKQTMRA